MFILLSRESDQCAIYALCAKSPKHHDLSRDTASHYPQLGAHLAYFKEGFFKKISIPHSGADPKNFGREGNEILNWVEC